jgi:DNA-binding MarR family transcriptional regulator
VKTGKSNSEKVFDSEVRLRILTFIALKGKSSFSEIKKALNLTDGNLSTHLQKLEEAEIIKVDKHFIGKRPRTTYQFTKEGKKRFMLYLEELESIIAKLKESKKAP